MTDDVAPTEAAPTALEGAGLDLAPPVVPLLQPRDGLPPVIETAEALADCIERFAAGTGPVAVDTERASGYRYGQRAYLVQLRREGPGTALIDPVGCPDLSVLGAALADAEWVVHAASQDLPCLAEIGMRPRTLFDTELAGRLLGLPRVGLGPLVESLLGYGLAKEHSAVDWSTRPLPEPWLRYAALDVEVLVELREALGGLLEEQGKSDWAAEEFAAISAAEPPAARVDPWRRTSGLHRVRGPRQLATVQALWEARDAMARRRDIAPGRILSDAAIVDAALAQPASPEALSKIPPFNGRATRRSLATWYAAVERAANLPDADLPSATLRSDAPPPARAWADRDPEAAERLSAARAVVAAIADEHQLPVENLLSPDLFRRVAWTPPQPADRESVAEFLRAGGAREWQIGLTATPIARAFERAALRRPTQAPQP